MKLPKTILASILVCSASTTGREADAQQSVSIPGHPNYHVSSGDAAPANRFTRTNSIDERRCYQALMEAERNPGLRNEKLITALREMAAVYGSSDRDKMNHYLRRAADAERRAGRDTSPSASQLAMNYFNAGDYVHAEPYLHQWLQEVETDFIAGGGPGRINYNAMNVLDHLAVVSLRMGKVVQAGTYLDRMKKLYDTAGIDHGAGIHYPAQFLKTYSDYLDKSGRSAEARQWKEMAATVTSTHRRYCYGCGRG